MYTLSTPTGRVPTVGRVLRPNFHCHTTHVHRLTHCNSVNLDLRTVTSKVPSLSPPCPGPHHTCAHTLCIPLGTCTGQHTHTHAHTQTHTHRCVLEYTLLTPRVPTGPHSSPSTMPKHPMHTIVVDMYVSLTAATMCVPYGP